MTYENFEGLVPCVKDGVVAFRFPNLMEYGDDLIHGFSSRLGGVSIGYYDSLNLGFNKNDKRENVLENYKKIGDLLSIEPGNMVFSNQVHDNKVKVVGAADKGKGIVKESDIRGYDALITDEIGVALVTFYADCVPVFFFDPVNKVIALAHSGWKSTLKEISKEVIEKFTKDFGSNRENIKTAIGPSINKCCFEVGEEVYCEFRKTFPWGTDYFSNCNNNKWLIDLQGLIKKCLANEGIPVENIHVSKACTKCHNNYFFSYRGDNGKTGSMAAFMQLK